MRIPGYEDHINLEPIEKGWSADRKYRMTMADGRRYLLRLSPLARYDTRMALHHLMGRLADVGLPMCKPIAVGRCDEGVYAVQGWIEGQDLKEVLPALAAPRQHALGLEAGRLLRAIHSIEAPQALESWDARFNRKIDRKIAQYRECPEKLAGDEHLLRYIEDNRQLLERRPQCFQHGDYHVGNMMLSEGMLHIIDFDRFDYGDPWEEFSSIVWCAQASPAFASGMVDGYFDGPPPLDFWQLLALYIACNTLSSLPWAIPFGQREVDVMRKLGQEVLSWYNNMTRLIPAWYLPETVGRSWE